MDKTDSDTPSTQQAGDENECGGSPVNGIDATKEAYFNPSSFPRSSQTDDAWIRYYVEWRDLENRLKARHEVSE